MADKLPEDVAALRRVGKVRQNGPVLENCFAGKRTGRQRLTVFETLPLKMKHREKALKHRKLQVYTGKTTLYGVRWCAGN